MRYVGASRELSDLLQRLATSIVEGLDVEMAAASLVEQDGDLSCSPWPDLLRGARG